MDTMGKNLRLAVMVFVCLALQTSGLPKLALDPANILLVNLPQKELDRQLDLALQYVDKQLHATYEDLLERHHSKLGHLHELAGKVMPRKRREMGISAFSSTENREMMKSEVIKIEELEFTCAEKVSKNSYIIQMNWEKYPWMVLDREGSEIQSTWITGPGGMHELRHLNPWKEEYRGCICQHQNLESNCICCRTGECMCPYCNRCTGCGDIICSNSTNEGESRLLHHEEAADVPVDLARSVVFQETQSMDNTVGSHIVLAEKNNEIYGFRFMGNDLVLPAVWRSTLNPITQLALVEIYDGGKRTLLLTFNHKADSHSYYELQMDNTGTYFLGWGGSGQQWSWDATGNKMHAISAGTCAFIIVVQENVLNIHKMQVDSTGDIKTYLMRKMNLPSNSTVLDLDSFQSGGRQYLLVSQTEQASLYKLLHKEQNFIFFQTLPLHDNMTAFERIFPVKGPKYSDEVVLVAGQESSVVFYTTNGTNTFEPANHQVLKHNRTDSLQWNNALAYIQNDTIVVCVMTKDSLLLHWKGYVSLDKAPYPVSEDLISLVENLEDQWQSQEKILSDFENVYAESLVDNSQVNGTVHIRGPVIVQEIKVNRHTYSKDATVREILSNQDNKTIVQTISQYMISVDHIKENLTKLACMMGEVNDTIQAAVLASGSDNVIYGRKNFTGIGVDINNFNVESLFPTQLSPHDDVLGRIIWQNQSEVIVGVKTFTNIKRIYDLQAITLDNVKVEKIPTIHADVHLSSYRSRGSLHISGDLEVQDGGTVANLVLRQDVIYLEEEGHHHFGYCTFKDDVYAASVALAGWVNDYNFTNLMQNSLKTYGDAAFHGSLSLLQPIIVSKVEAKSVMDVDIEEFMSNVVFTKERDTSVAGTIEFLSSVEIMYDLNCTRLFNEHGKRIFPQEFLQYSPKMNLGERNLVLLETALLEVDGLLNFNNKSSYITLSTGTIDSLILARGADFTSIKTEVLIDGVNLTDVERWLDSSSHKYDIIFLEPVSVGKDVTVSGNINDGDLEKLTKNLIYRYDSYAILTGSKTFTECDVNNATGNGTINGIDISSFVNLGSPETIFIGTKTFVHGVSFYTVEVGLVDGISVKDVFNNMIYLDKQDQVVYGNKMLSKTLTTNSLSVSGKLSGLELERFFSTKGTQIFKENQIWTNCVFYNISAATLTLRNGATVNNIDFSELNKMRVSLSNPVNITSITIDGQLEVLSKFQVNKINGVDVPSSEDFVQTERENQIIKGHVEFENIFVDYIDTQEKRGANHMNISDISVSAVNVTQDNLLLKGLKFKHIKFFKQVEVQDGLISGVNISSLMLDAVVYKPTTVQNIKGRKVFQTGLGFLGNVMSKNVNGRELSKTLLRKHSDQVITGRYTTTTVTVNRSVTLDALFNVYNITDIINKMYGSAKTLKGFFTFNEVEVNELQLLGNLNGTAIDALLEDAVRLDYNPTPVVFTATQVLENVVFSNLMARRVNGLEVDPVFENLLRTNRPEKLENGLIAGTVYASQIWAEQVSTTMIFGMKMKIWEDIVYCSRNHSIKGRKVFTDVSVQTSIRLGTFEGIELSKDVLNTNKFQNISSMVFTNIYVDEVETKYLNSFDVNFEVENTLLGTGNQTFKVPVRHPEELQIMNDMKVFGNIDGRKWDFKKDVVPLNTSSHVLGVLNFQQPVVSAWLNSSTYTLNNINVLELMKEAWYKDRDTNIGANYTLHSVVMKEMVNSLTPEPLGRLTENLADMQTQLGQMYWDDYAYKCRALKYLQDELQNQLYEPDYLSEVYKHDFRANVASSATFMVNNSVYVVTSWENSCLSNVFMWNETLRELIFVDQLETGWVRLWHHLKQYQVLVSEVMDGAGCGDSSTTWWYGGPLANGVVTLQALGSSQIWPALHASILKLKDGREHAVGDVIFLVSNSSVKVLDTARNTLTVLDCSAVVESSLAFESGNLPHFAAIITRAEIGGVTYNFKILRYYPFSNLLTEVLTMTLSGHAAIDKFSVGHGGAAIHYIVLAVENGFSQVYICKGVSRPQVWTELLAFNTDWLQVFQDGTTYVIFGTGRHGLVSEVKMKGGHFTPVDLQCSFQEEGNSRAITTLRTEPPPTTMMGLPHFARTQSSGYATTGLPVPATTGLPVPATTRSPVPATTGSPVPATTGSPVPATTGSPVPATIESPVPDTTESPVPATTGSPVPATTGSPVPATTGSPVPATSGSPIPTTARSPEPTITGPHGRNTIESTVFGGTGPLEYAAHGLPRPAFAGLPGSATTELAKSSTGFPVTATPEAPSAEANKIPSPKMPETSTKKKDSLSPTTSGSSASTTTRTYEDNENVLFDIDLPNFDLPFLRM